MLDQQSQNFLQLIRSHLWGTSPQLKDPDWEKIYQMALIHNLVPMICEAARTLPEFSQADPKVSQHLIHTAVHQATRQYMQTEELFRVYDAFLKEGLHPALLKGALCRSLYPEPDYRVSGDEDLWIPKKDWRRCHQVLLSQGYTMEDSIPSEKLLDTTQEVTYSNQLLTLEMHINPFGTADSMRVEMNQIFQGALDRLELTQVLGHKVYTLEPTDNYLFLFVHLYKHFLGSGVGIRMILDLMLYLEAHKQQLQKARILSAVQKLRAKDLYLAVIQIGVLYLGFPKNQFFTPPTDRDLLDALINDLLESGCFGKVQSFQNISSLYTSSLTEGKGSLAALWASMFPSYRRMLVGYPFITGKPYLLPAAWGLRFFRFFGKLAKSQRGRLRASLARGKRRAKLMQSYHIFRKKGKQP